MSCKVLFIIGTLVLLNPRTTASGQDSSWRLEDIQEVKCSDVRPLPGPREKKRDSELQELIMDLRYYPYMNKFALYAASMVNRGKGIRSDEEIGTACMLRRVFYPAKHMVKYRDQISTAFGRNIGKKCDSTNLRDLHCHSTENDVAATENSEYLRLHGSIMWSDYKENALYLSCYGNDVLGWHVKSKRRKLSPRTKRTVLKQVTKLGFKERNAIEVPYAGCF